MHDRPRHGFRFPLPLAAGLLSAGMLLPGPAWAQPAAGSGMGRLVAPREGNQYDHQVFQPEQGPVQQREKQAGIAPSASQQQATQRELNRIARELGAGSGGTAH